MPQIRIKNGRNKGKVIALKSANRLVLGRDATCGVQIVDQGVSREHAEIFRVGEMIFIRDLKSRNGTFVNDERIEEELLREGDNIRVGGTQMVFESGQNASEPDVEFEENENEPFKTSLELKLDDLYVVDGGLGGRGGELFKAICLATQIVQSERDEKKLFDRLLDLIQDYIPADHTYLFLRDEVTGAVTPRAMRQKGNLKNIPISRSILRRVITEARAILTADAMQDDRFKADDSIMMHQLRSVLCVPVQSGNSQAMGAIYCVNTSLTDTFEQSDLQLMTAIGAQLSLSLENLNSIRIRRRMFLRVIGRLMSLLEGMPPNQRGHSERVANFTLAVATEMGLSDRDILYAVLAALLHDIGKIPAVSGLSSSASERSTGVAHILAGVEYIKDLPGVMDAIPAIRTHHERFDGSGIPQQLQGDAIPLGGRIVAVVSDFDKIIYPPGKPIPDGEPDPALVKKALTELDQQAGKLYDPNVVRALIVCYRHGTLRNASPFDSGAKHQAVKGEPPVLKQPTTAAGSGRLPVSGTNAVLPAVETGETVRTPRTNS